MVAQSRQSRVETVCLVILTAVAGAAALFWLRPVMIPFVLAIFVSLGLSAAIDFQVKTLRVPGPLALPVTLLVGGLAFTLLGALVSASVGELAANSGTYNAQFAELIARAVRSVPFNLLGFVAEADLANLSSIPLSAVRTLLAGTTNALLEIISQSFLVIIFVAFLMVGSGRRSQSTGTWGEIEQRVKRYLVVKAGISAFTGLLVGGVLAILGVPLALVFGLFAFLLNFIPSIGSIIATLLPLPVILFSPEVTGAAVVLALVLPGVIQVGIGNIFEPKIMGESLDLHPVVILLMLIFWGMLWGIAGMLLATPLSAIMKILFDKIESTRPIAELMAGRVENLRSPANDTPA